MNIVDWLNTPGEDAVDVNDSPELAYLFDVPPPPPPTIRGTDVTASLAQSVWHAQPNIAANPDYARALLTQYPVEVKTEAQMRAAAEWVDSKIASEVALWKRAGWTEDDISDQVTYATESLLADYEATVEAQMEQELEDFTSHVESYAEKFAAENDPAIVPAAMEFAVAISNDHPDMPVEDVFDKAKKSAEAIGAYAEDAQGLPGMLQQAVAGIPGMEDVEFLSTPDIRAIMAPDPGPDKQPLQGTAVFHEPSQIDEPEPVMPDYKGALDNPVVQDELGRILGDDFKIADVEPSR